MFKFLFALFLSSYSLQADENPYQKASSINNPKGKITPTVTPRIEKGYGLFLDSDFIYWKASSPLTFGTSKINQINPKFKYSPGFKAGIGMDLHHDGWDTYAEYTWLHPPLTITSYANGTLNFPIEIPFETLTLKKKSHFHILDLELGRDFFISKFLTLRPNLGLKLANLYEREKLLLSSEKYIFKQNTDGIGIRAGIDTVWHITAPFGIYGNFAFTPLLSHLHDEVSNLSTLLSASSFDTIIPVIEASIGLSYKTNIYQNRFSFYFSLGFEEQVFLNYNYTSQEITSASTLSMEGVTLKAGFVF